MTSKTASQFTCVICGQGFEQKSRLQRQMDISHPPSAPSAADLREARTNMIVNFSQCFIILRNLQGSFLLEEYTR